MPNAYIINQRPQQYGETVSLLVEMLVEAGWTYRASGDGIANYSATGKVFTHTGSGAFGWNNQYAWAQIAAPNGREIVVMHNAAGSAHIRCSVTGFNSGSSAISTSRTASDQRYLKGGSTQTTNPWLVPGAVVQGAAMGDAPYGFWFAGVNAGRVLFGLMMDPVVGAAEDPDPYVWMIGDYGAFRIDGYVDFVTANAMINPPGGVVFGYFGHMDLGCSQFLQVPPYTYQHYGLTTTTDWLPTSGAINPFSGRMETLPVVYGRSARFVDAATPITQYPGIKGISTLTQNATVQLVSGRDTTDNGALIYMGSYWLPWCGVAPDWVF